MFDRARRRLTWLYVGIFAGVLALFSGAFWLVLAVILQPTFDLGPELSSGEAADIVYHTGLERAGFALLAADLLAVLIVAGAAWFLARRTLRPIQEATQRQARFVADASHEIRSPLAAIRSTAEAGLIGDRPAAELRSALASVVTSAGRLSRVANDLLLLARSEHGQLPASQQPFDLSVAVAEAVDAERIAALNIAAAPVAGEADAPPDPRQTERVAMSLSPDLTVMADATEVTRIVTNLVENGLRHGGGRISVRTLAAGNEAIVEVSDRGPGIEPQDLDRIFQPFFRGRADAEAPDGTGLGLAIATGLARRNGGRVTVESRLGGGSTFRLVMPIAR